MTSIRSTLLAAAHDALRSGAWLTRERVRTYPTIIGGALAIALLLLVLTGHGGRDWRDRPLGTDFVGVWVAGGEVLAGHPELPYDNAAHAAAQAKAFGPSDSFLPWGYPPLYLVVAAALATMPYLLALALFQGGTLALYLAVVRRAARGIPWREGLVPALAFPAVAINLMHGHNGLLSAALLAGGALALPRRPLLAGLLWGLLAYKPQFGLAIPVALFAGRQWRATLACGGTVLMSAAATIMIFGVAPWPAFVGSLAFTRRVVLEQGGIESYKLQSAFGAVRLLGGSAGLAYAVQATVSGIALVGLAWLWRGAADGRLKLAGLVLAALLATPYVVDYDLTMLAPALAALVSLGLERGFAPYARSALALAWIMPLVARTIAGGLFIPLGAMTMVGLFGIVLIEARRTRSSVVAVCEPSLVSPPV